MTRKSNNAKPKTAYNHFGKGFGFQCATCAYITETTWEEETAQRP